MSNERGCECPLQEQAATPDTTNCPNTYEHAELRACRTQHSECLKPMHGLASGSGLCSWKKLWGLTTGMNLTDFPSKFRTKPGMSASLTLKVCTRFSCGLLASVDQLTDLACRAKKAPMSISVSVSQKERRLGLCLLPPLVNLDFGCSCGLCRLFDPGVLPLLLSSRPLLLPRPRPLPLPVRFLLVKEVLFWRTLLLPSP